MKAKPRIRTDAIIDLQSALEKVAAETGLLRTCVTCDNFLEGQELCRLANARPPARVIAYGCNSYYSKNEIPF